MAETEEFNDLVDKYRDIQNKFDYFFLSVILGSLALSIQYFNPTITPKSTYLIILSWILFTISFISGLLRQERSNLHMYVEIGNIDNPERINRFTLALNDQLVLRKSNNEIWTKQEINEELGKIKIKENISTKILRIYSKQVQILYQIKKWCYLLGLLTYALYRITNIIFISHLTEIVIILLLIICTRIIIFIYKKRLPKINHV